MCNKGFATIKIPSKVLEHSEGNMAGAMHISQWYYTMDSAERKVMIYEVLKIGERNALSPDYLRATLGLTSNRAVQKQIEKERGQGKVILSSTQPPGGYFLPETKLEIRQFIKTLENRGNKTLDILGGARKLLAEFEEKEGE